MGSRPDALPDHQKDREGAGNTARVPEGSSRATARCCQTVAQVSQYFGVNRFTGLGTYGT